LILFAKTSSETYFCVAKIFENTWFWVQNCENMWKNNENQWESMKIDENPKGNPCFSLKT